MNALNSILLEGNLTKDPELKELPSASVVCSFSIASNRSFKKGDEWEQEVSYFDVEAWGKLGESVGRNCNKGRGVRVVGRIKQERWNDTDGKTRSKVKIIAEHVEFKPLQNTDNDSKPQQSARNDSAPPDFPDDKPV